MIKGINLSSVVIPKARGTQTSLFRVGTPKGREDMSVSLPCIGREIRYHFSHVFAIALVVGKACKMILT